MTRSSALNWIHVGVAVALIASGCIDDPYQVGRAENRAGASGTLSNGGVYSVGGLGAIGGNGEASAVGGNVPVGGITSMGGIPGAGGSSTGGLSSTGPVVDELSLTFHSCARLSDGTVQCWGDNGLGQLGDGTTANQSSPVLVRGLAGAVEIAAGVFHSCARLGEGTVECWGINSSGRLGDGTTSGVACSIAGSKEVYRLTPVVVQGLSGAVEIAAGEMQSCARLSDGTVKCWGANGCGQLGDGTTTGSATPVLVKGLSGAVQIATRGYHSCALLNDGTVECWGANGYGQLGDGTMFGVACTLSEGGALWSDVSRLTPVVVQGLSGAVEIATGIYHSCSRLGDGTVKCWGQNSGGQLGDGTTTDSPTPVLVKGLP